MEKQYILTPYWGTTHSMSEVIDDDQIFYGKENLKLARGKWRRQERSLLRVDLSDATYMQREQHRMDLEKTRWAIAHLKTLALDFLAESKPVLPNLRPDNWFKPGDQVVCWLNSRDPYKPLVENGCSCNAPIGRVEGIDQYRRIVVDLCGPTRGDGFYRDCNYSHHHILKHIGFSPFILHEKEYQALKYGSDEYRELWCSYAHPGDLDELKLFLG